MPGEYDPRLCECGHAAGRHDRVSYKDGRAPDYLCLDPGCPCTNLWKVDAPMNIEAVWGDDSGITWGNADPATKESFTLVRLYWFFRMIDCGGPDGSDLDAEVADQAREAAEWFGPILAKRAGL